MVGERLAREAAQAARHKARARAATAGFGSRSRPRQARRVSRRQLRSLCGRDLLHHRPDRVEAHRTACDAVRRRPLRRRRARSERPARRRSLIPPQAMARGRRLRSRGSPSRRTHARHERHRESRRWRRSTGSGRGILLRRAGMRKPAAARFRRCSIQPPDGARPVRLLSGGNQQKVLRRQMAQPGRRDMLILDEPTVGVDVGAKAEIYAMLRRERERGAALLVVSSDLEEVMTHRRPRRRHGRRAACRRSMTPTRVDMADVDGRSEAAA